jgi:hypothetical protein
MKFETFISQNIPNLEDKLCGYISEDDKCPLNKGELISCRECLTMVANEIYKSNTIS